MASIAGKAALLLASAPRCRNLAGAHQVTNVFLEELVVVVELVVLFPHSLDAVEDGEERLLQKLGMLSQLFARLLAQLVEVLVRPSRAHGSHVVWPKVRVHGADG